MRRLLSAALLLVAVACGDNSISGTRSVSGTYVLQSVNGASLPVVIQASNPRIELLSDIIVLDRGNTWTESVQVRQTTSTGSTSIQSSDDGGFYSLSGNTIVLEYRDGTTDTGTISADGTIAFNSGSGSSIFRRQ